MSIHITFTTAIAQAKARRTLTPKSAVRLNPADYAEIESSLVDGKVWGFTVTTSAEVPQGEVVFTDLRRDFRAPSTEGESEHPVE